MSFDALIVALAVLLGLVCTSINMMNGDKGGLIIGGAFLFIVSAGLLLALSAPFYISL